MFSSDSLSPGQLQEIRSTLEKLLGVNSEYEMWKEIFWSTHGFAYSSEEGKEMTTVKTYQVLTLMGQLDEAVGYWQPGISPLELKMNRRMKMGLMTRMFLRKLYYLSQWGTPQPGEHIVRYFYTDRPDNLDFFCDIFKRVPNEDSTLESKFTEHRKILIGLNYSGPKCRDEMSCLISEHHGIVNDIPFHDFWTTNS